MLQWKILECWFGCYKMAWSIAELWGPSSRREEEEGKRADLSQITHLLSSFLLSLFTSFASASTSLAMFSLNGTNFTVIITYFCCTSISYESFWWTRNWLDSWFRFIFELTPFSYIQLWIVYSPCWLIEIGKEKGRTPIFRIELKKLLITPLFFFSVEDNFSFFFVICRTIPHLGFQDAWLSQAEEFQLLLWWPPWAQMENPETEMLVYW